MCVFVLKLWSSLEKSKWPCHAEIFRICKLDEYLVDFLFLVFYLPFWEVFKLPKLIRNYQYRSL